MSNRLSKISFVVLLLLAMLATSCELDLSNNGKLDGYWRMMRVDTLETGGSLDLSQKLIFWSFDVRLMEVVDRNPPYADYLMHFSHERDSLFLMDAHKYKQETVDSLVTDTKELEPFGINRLKDKFAVEKLTGSKMTLRSETVRLWFDKY